MAETFRIKLEALFHDQGLIFLGAVRPEISQDFQRYQTWLEDKRHAGMTFLEQNQEARSDLGKVLPGTRSVLAFALPYSFDEEEKTFRFAKYSQFRDYHKLLKEKGEAIISKLSLDFPGDFRVVVDSAPVLERTLASQASDGFIGKNTCYIHPVYGSFLLLGEILTTVLFNEELKKASSQEACGTCTLCQVECPTGALDEDYRMDARKCIAYWTIENRSVIPFEYWAYLEDYLFGCDLCQNVCPYNQEAAGRLPSKIERRLFPSVFEIATMDQRQYESYFGGTPATRARREGLRRNALIALTVSKDVRLNEALAFVDRDPHPVLEETRSQIEWYLQNWREASVETAHRPLNLDKFSTVLKPS